MKIQIKITSSGNASYYNVPIGTIVEEELEKYVAAVVASEIGNAPLDACKAQAVASRTFAYRYVLNGKPIPDGSVAQAYRAERYIASYRTCIRAAEETKGQILTYRYAPADTYFCHSNGGIVVSSQEKWGGAREYLVSKPDPWDAATRMNRSGHGVGMSQVGAKYAAQQGVSCQEILAFYYPGTILSTIGEKEGKGMVTLAQFLNGCQRNAARIHGYKKGCNGSNGYSDCIGYIIGALELEGQKWGGTHGSNYAARNRTRNLHQVTAPSQLKLGQLVYKAYKPGTAEWEKSFPKGTYKNSPDQNDYYHVGVVTSINPLTISHCSSGGMHYDKSLGKWSYAGDCSLVDYGSGDSAEPETTPDAPATGEMVVDVPDDTSVNVRNKASTNGSILARLPEGTKVTVTGVNGEWSKVEYRQTGYIMSKYLRKG